MNSVGGLGAFNFNQPSKVAAAQGSVANQSQRITDGFAKTDTQSPGVLNMADVRQLMSSNEKTSDKISSLSAVAFHSSSQIATQLSLNGLNSTEFFYLGL